MSHVYLLMRHYGDGFTYSGDEVVHPFSNKDTAEYLADELNKAWPFLDDDNPFYVEPMDVVSVELSDDTVNPLKGLVTDILKDYIR